MKSCIKSYACNNLTLLLLVMVKNKNKIVFNYNNYMYNVSALINCYDIVSMCFN